MGLLIHFEEKVPGKVERNSVKRFVSCWLLTLSRKKKTCWKNMSLSKRVAIFSFGWLCYMKIAHKLKLFRFFKPYVSSRHVWCYMNNWWFFKPYMLSRHVWCYMNNWKVCTPPAECCNLENYTILLSYLIFHRSIQKKASS